MMDLLEYVLLAIYQLFVKLQIRLMQRNLRFRRKALLFRFHQNTME